MKTCDKYMKHGILPLYVCGLFVTTVLKKMKRIGYFSVIAQKIVEKDVINLLL